MTDSDRLRTALAEHYAIERELGSGGMATVYLAEDVKHERPVAVKVLRPELAAALGPERFLREIKVTARLNHPHILPLLDSGDAGGFLYYVMPYVEGESLRQRLNRERQLPIADALGITIEVADALGSAHAHGVVHRDIKPENVLLEEGHAVVADFGIARAISEAGGDKLTQTGLVVGTPTYMSPEQASGDEVDGRSDIYGLGCVLYEMLAGEPPFTGPTAQAIIAKRLSQPPPDITAIRNTVPEAVGRAITTALAQLPADRFRDAAQFAAVLGEIAPTPTQPALRAGSVGALAGWNLRRRLAFGALFSVFIIAVVVSLALLTSRKLGNIVGAPEPSRTLSQLTFGEGLEQWPTWSPEGDRLAYSAESGGYSKLFVRTLETSVEEQLSVGRPDDIRPTWSPDGTRIAFVRSNLPRGKLEPADVLGYYNGGGDIWTMDLDSRDAALLVRDAFNPAYSPDGAQIAFDARFAGPRRIWLTDTRGRNPLQVTTDSSEAIVHTEPRWSPDGSRIVFRRIEKSKSDIFVVDLASQTAAAVTDDNLSDMNPVWSPSGEHIYFSSSRGGGLNVWRVPVTSAGQPTGPPEQLTTGAGNDVQLSLAPAGARLAFTVLGINSDLWRLPLDPRTGRPVGAAKPVIATTREESRGTWSPDGSRIAFNSDRMGEMNLWVGSVEQASDRQLTKGPGGDYQPTWSPDGESLTFFSARAGNNDIWTVDVTTGRLTQLTDAPSMEANPFYSPDGRLIAFHSDRSGRQEVWVMKADGSDQEELTTIGAAVHFMRWSPDARSVIFRSIGPAGPEMHQVDVEERTVKQLPDILSGAHISFSPDRSLVMDVRGHKTLWVHSSDGADPYRVFEFDNPDIRIDYPVWSPDGRWVLFDRAAPKGGDIWVLGG